MVQPTTDTLVQTNLDRAIFVDPPEDAVCFECGAFFVEGFGEGRCSLKGHSTKPNSKACSEFNRKVTLAYKPKGDVATKQGTGRKV